MRPVLCSSAMLLIALLRPASSYAAALRGAPASDRVVLFVHGAGTPAEVAFDAADDSKSLTEPRL